MSRLRIVRSVVPSPESDLFWVTQDGRKIEVSQLDDFHLENIINMLEGRGMKSLFRFHQLKATRLVEGRGEPTAPSDEEVGMEMESSLSFYGRTPSHPHVKIYNSLLQEKQMRVARGDWSPRNKTKALRRP